MTRKDYKIIAEAILNSTEEGKRLINKENLMHELCMALLIDNPKFNASRFREACGDIL